MATPASASDRVGESFVLYAMGRRTVKVLPVPGVLDTSAVPPWRRAICRTMNRPSPVPSLPERAGAT